MTKKLSELRKGEKAMIVRVNLNGLTRRRLFDLGFIPGTIVSVLFESPLGDPVAYLVRDTIIALRKDESEKIEVELIN
ncbi:MAG: ferrous iron transport protein A [Ignavibacteria bacterium]|nr:ferrous iron transport protein A [Ignavibacteria bacterium]